MSVWVLICILSVCGDAWLNAALKTNQWETDSCEEPARSISSVYGVYMCVFLVREQYMILQHQREPGWGGAHGSWLILGEMTDAVGSQSVIVCMWLLWQKRGAERDHVGGGWGGNTGRDKLVKRGCRHGDELKWSWYYELRYEDAKERELSCVNWEEKYHKTLTTFCTYTVNRCDSVCTHKPITNLQ